MDISYYLSLKNTYERIKYNLVTIIDCYNSLLNDNNLNHIQKQINSYKYKLGEIQSIINDINKHLKNNCKHIYIEDSIDIHPDKSQNIIYCQICEETI
jgi:hypothetical protein